jgi:hypothetical protein
MTGRHTLRFWFIAFHVTLGVVVMLQSLNTLLHAAGHDGERHVALAWFAGAEAVAAALFLIPATLRAGAYALLAIFAHAFAFHAVHGEFQSTLLVYAAGVLLVLAHGSAFGRGGLRQSAAA